MTNEQEIVRSVFDAYIRDAKASSTKKDRPTFDMLEEVKNRAIKALEQPTSDDCMSRAEVFEIMGNLMSIPYDFDRPINEDDVSESMDKIKDLPSVTPTQRWIPVSERLPDPQENEDYIFTDWVQVSIRINAHQSMVCSAYYCFSEMKWYMERMGCGEIIAWQPLPQPYEEK